MGLMMWVMMRGNKQQPADTVPKQAEPASLQARIDQLQAQQDHARHDATPELRPLASAPSDYAVEYGHTPTSPRGQVLARIRRHYQH